MPTRRSSSPRSRVAAPSEEAPIVSSRESSASKTKRPSPFALLIVGVVIVVAIVLATKNALRGTTPEDTSSQNVAAENFDALITKVSRHIVINASESPSIATIEDPELLRSQNPGFYALASKGDRLLIWSDKALLYSESQDKILAVIPLQVPPPEQTTSTASQPTEEIPTVQVRNGSGVAGLGRTITTNISTAGMKTLPARDASVRTGYSEALIYVASGKSYPTWLSKLQEITGGKIVTELPNEQDLNGDIVVILGANTPR